MRVNSNVFIWQKGLLCQSGRNTSDTIKLNEEDKVFVCPIFMILTNSRRQRKVSVKKLVQVTIIVDNQSLSFSR